MDKAVRITFIGDVMCKASMLSSYQRKGGGFDFTPLFEQMAGYFSKSDYVVANLETPISEDNTGLSSETYRFCSPYEFAEAVKACGIGFVATANNHCLDKGIDGIASTVRALDRVGLVHTGIFSNPERRAPVVVDVCGIQIGLMSYTYGTNAFMNNCYLSKDEQWHVNQIQEQELSNPALRFLYRHLGGIPYRFLCRSLSPFSENARRPVYERRERSEVKRRLLLHDLARMKEREPDLIVMCVHMGGQYSSEATEDTRALTDWLLDHGVDIVVGSHEHVVHGGVFHRPDGKVAAYCLGNFDGIAGVYDGPYDKMAEYSIAWNLYLSPGKCGIEALSSASYGSSVVSVGEIPA